MSEAVALPSDEERRRRNVRLAIAHAVVALAILAAFVWFQVQR